MLVHQRVFRLCKNLLEPLPHVLVACAAWDMFPPRSRRRDWGICLQTPYVLLGKTRGKTMKFPENQSVADFEKPSLPENLKAMLHFHFAKMRLMWRQVETRALGRSRMAEDHQFAMMLSEGNYPKIYQDIMPYATLRYHENLEFTEERRSQVRIL